jgi:hypothetical protein
MNRALSLLRFERQFAAQRLTDAVWAYQRGPDDPRVVGYPG